jgi:flagellar biosynthesis/type III secretory pathway M-ring protein FliF/YscJ
LSSNELRAITFHLTSAVRGLSPNKVAISDTTGKMYQGLDYDGSQDGMRNSEIAMEEHLKSKIEGMLAAIVGINNYYINVQVLMNRNHIIEERNVYSGNVNGTPLGQPVVSSIKKSNEQEINNLQDLFNGKLPSEHPPSADSKEQADTEQFDVPVDHVKITSQPGKIESISIGVLINENVLGDTLIQDRSSKLIPNKSELKQEIENQLDIILKGYNVPVQRSVDFAAFRKPILPEALPPSRPSPQTSSAPMVGILLILLGGIVLVLLLWLRGQYLKLSALQESPPPKKSGSLEEMLDGIRKQIQTDPQKIADSLKTWIKEDKN